MSETEELCRRSTELSQDDFYIKEKEEKASTLKKTSANIPKRHENAINAMLERLPEVDKHFNIHRKIGEGTFSNVYLATFKKLTPDIEQRKYAIKHLIPTCHPKRIKCELDCLVSIGGKDNVVPCLSSVRRFDCVIFIMPYLEHQKFADYVVDMDVEETRLYMRNLLLALRRVHSFNIIHRDIKPSNFLYNRHTKQFLLVDFGLAQSVNGEATCTDVVIKTDTKQEPIKKRKRDNEENHETEEKPCTQPVKRQALQILPKDLSNQLKPTKPLLTYGNRKLLNNSGRQNQPLSSMQRMAEAAQVKRNLENSLSYNYQNNSLLKKDTVINNLNVNSVKRQPLSTNNSVNVFSISPKKAVVSQLPTFQNLLPKKCMDTGSSFVRVQNSQVQDGSMFPKPMAPVRRTLVCDCQGKPQVCNTCLVRKAQNAPRAGTPGFRPPEVLLRYHQQTTAVDMWAAGIIMVCILSGCYPFFRSPDDVTALSEIIAVFGSECIFKLAKKLGRNVMCSATRKPLYLRALCERLHTRKCDGESVLPILPSCEGCNHGIDPLSGCLCEHKYKPNPNAMFYPDSAYDLLKRLLDVDPESRISAEEALKHPFLATLDSLSQN